MAGKTSLEDKIREPRSEKELHQAAIELMKKKRIEMEFIWDVYPDRK